MTMTISVCITMLWKNGTRQWEFPWVHNHFFSVMQLWINIDPQTRMLGIVNDQTCCFIGLV